MTDHLDHAGLRRLLRKQDGVLSQEQALELGIDIVAARRRVAAGTWVRAAHHAYRSAEHPDTARARLRAAVLSLGEGAVVVGSTAAWWWKLLDTPPPAFEIAVDRARRPRERDGVLLRRRWVAVEDTIAVDGVRVTRKALTTLDVVATLPLVEGAELLDRVLNSGSVALDELRHVQLGRAGRPGTTRVRELLALAGGRARSEAERTAHGLLLAAGITGWFANLGVVLPGYGRVELDVAFAERRLVVEIDGWSYHRSLRAFLRDRRRQNALTLAGWTVLRLTWFDLVRDPDGVLATIRAALALPATGT